MLMRDLEAKLLLVLLKGPSWFYALVHRHKVASNKIVLTDLNLLQQKGLIETCNNQVEQTRGGRDRKFYRLTTLGIITAMSYANLEHVRRKVDRWEKQLPMVLGKIDLFRQHDLETRFLETLISFTRGFIVSGIPEYDPRFEDRPTVAEKFKELSSEPELEQLYAERFYYHFFAYAVSQNPEKTSNYVACARDPEIVDILKRGIERTINSYKALILQEELHLKQILNLARSTDPHVTL